MGTRSSRGRRLAAVAGVCVALSFAVSCVHRGYPLGKTGSVEIRVDVAANLFAADVLDTSGKPAEGPRQQPAATGVTLYMSENGEGAYGGFVDVRVDPPQALALQTGDDTCEKTAERFRCTANEEGFARFVAASESDWSGDATLIVEWAGANGSNNRKLIPVLPAGLPPGSTNFALIVEGQSGTTDRVPATFDILRCTFDPTKEAPVPKWREGKIRKLRAFARASAPQNAPSSVDHAPVVIETLSSEGQLSLAEDCADRKSRLRVLLGATGESDPFYLCFSDKGGTIDYTFVSGKFSLDRALALGEPDKVTIQVDTEPLLLKVHAVSTDLVLDPAVFEPATVDVEVTAYDSDLRGASMTVEARSENLTKPEKPLVLEIAPNSSSTFATVPVDPIAGGANEPPSAVRLNAHALGVGRLVVTPNLLSGPECLSEAITVTGPTP